MCPKFAKDYCRINFILSWDVHHVTYFNVISLRYTTFSVSAKKIK